METKQLRTFKVASENLNFTRTAKIVNFAQSSVTAQIKALELELGTPLFERLGKRLLLTEAGERFKVYAERMILLEEDAKGNVNGGEEPAGTLIIGAQESQCTYRLPPILKEFKVQFPRVKLIFKPAHSDEIAKKQLKEGLLDLAFVTDLSDSSDTFESVHLAKESIIMVAAANHPILSKHEVTPADLENETLLLTETGCSYRTILEESFRSSDVFPSNKIEFVSIEAIKQCVIAGLGIAILPAMAVEADLKTGKMEQLPWQKFTTPIHTQITWHKDKQLTTPLKEFIEITKRWFKEYGSYTNN
ncbi:LysR family transcriptional regulator [Virgibacillus flavescens]|uniref:LysR family transcriptional regulator n=1 Tax=Virgibacillus flavescens TaxID=1611422 RepID=UPI003D343E29